ncbi:MAG: adenylosuccinate lyase [Acidobacteria bacterium 13_1_40CM_2_60_7]|nr:MAG: adenylosuccinate lyase [Acidobacteria bacterium 13_1_40CM_4_61_5]OLD62481.1 MAG: adenylosuccinate lyase [Acidobacteria bacterium 13_1_40CM_2_60_7]
MIPRYTREEMGRVWGDANRFAKWLEVELAATETLADAGQVPRAAAATIRERAKINVQRIHELESRVKHDVIAFTMSVGESIGDASAARWLHHGLTSNDVVDTAQALLVRDASRLIERGLTEFGDILALRAQEFRHTPQIGRTHGIHAEPITFGLKIANWYAENQRNQERFRNAAAQMAVGKISGAVGTASHLGPDVEERICQRLGLNVAPVASQVIQRDRHAHYMSALALIAATLEKIALEIRHLQRTEVREAEEPFAEEQRGSSAMPHKRNPVSCEQICGLARLVRSNLIAAFENVPLWHERDISHSSVERIILPDSTILVDYMLAKMTTIISEMRVFPERMLRNLEATRGLIFSGQLLQDLVEKGMPRDDAYKAVQENAMAAWETESSFRERVAADARITKYLDMKAVEHTFDLKRQLRYVDAIFARVFGEKSAAKRAQS